MDQKVHSQAMDQKISVSLNHSVSLNFVSSTLDSNPWK